MDFFKFKIFFDQIESFTFFGGESVLQLITFFAKKCHEMMTQISVMKRKVSRI